MLRPKELIDRWNTTTGKAIRHRAIAALVSSSDIRPILRDLEGADEVFDWMDLRGIDLSRLSFSSDSFHLVSLDFACLDYCEFLNGHFDNSSLLYATFNHAKFIGTQMTSAK